MAAAAALPSGKRASEDAFFGTGCWRLIEFILAVLHLLEKRFVEENNPVFVCNDVAKLLERARRAREETQKLSSDYRFIISWLRMRPRFTVHPASMLEGED